MEPAEDMSPEAWIERGRKHVSGYIEQAGRDLPRAAFLLALCGLDGEPFARPMNLALYDTENVGPAVFARGVGQAACVMKAVACVLVCIDWERGFAAYASNILATDTRRIWFAPVSETDGKVWCGPWIEGTLGEGNPDAN